MPTITDWLMVAITAVYVVATIFICRANLESAKASREQIAESKRQFDEENRAYITYSFIYEKRAFYGISFIQIHLKQAFIDSLDEAKFVSSLNSLSKKESVLGVNQSLDIYFGTSRFRENQDKLPIEGEVIYSDDNGEYSEHFFIDFNNYPPIFSVNGIEEDIRDEIKQHTKELAKIQTILHSISESLPKEEEDA